VKIESIIKDRPVLNGLYQLSEVPAAMRYFGEGNHKGKILNHVSHDV